MQTRIDEAATAAPGGTYVVRLPKDEVVELPLRQPAGPGQQQERKAAPAGTEYIVRVQRDRVFGVPPSHLPENMPPPPENYYRRRCCSLILLVAVIYLVLRFRHPSAGGNRQ